MSAPSVRRAAAARGCRPLAAAHRLATWVGDARPVTANGALTMADAAEAIQALGLRPPGDVPELDARQAALFPAVDTRDLAHKSAGLAGAWNIALDVDFLEVTGACVAPGRALTRWPAGSDDDVVAVWREAFRSVLALRLEPGEDAPDELAAVFRELLEVLYEEAPMSLLALRDRLIARTGRRIFGGDEYWERVRRCGIVLSHAVARLVDAGALALERDVVALTTLGRWAWGEEIIYARTAAKRSRT